jgi:bifunctional UDP-N-acetylglucosamine pyrophosphorylase/glucosamine-1-phosphate N-acetyltransferase
MLSRDPKGSGRMAKRTAKALILAAGMSTRMKSARSKVLHEVCGKTILAYVLDACREAGIEDLLVVVGHARDQVMEAFGGAKDITWVVQEPQQGTAHAVMVARDAMKGFQGDLVVLVGDAPLVRAETVRALLEAHRREKADVTLVTAVLEDPKWFGRIVRDRKGNLRGIVEAKDATAKEQAIKEVNPSFYAFRWPALERVLGRITNKNAKGEYYLTDAIGLLIKGGSKAVAVSAAEPEEVEAVNSQEDLAVVAGLARQRILRRLMAEGVTIEDPATTYIDWDVEVGAETWIGPCTVIHGPARIGKNCRVGPLAHLRPGTVLEDGAEVGAFVETKEAHLGSEVCVRHHAYLGDCEVGARTNIGAGTLTANSDGRKKYRTKIGKDASIGAGTVLVAPTSVGDGGRTGAGSVVTKAHPVPAGETYVGVPAKPHQRKSREKH